jgi:hypothetical protein
VSKEKIWRDCQITETVLEKMCKEYEERYLGQDSRAVFSEKAGEPFRETI